MNRAILALLFVGLVAGHFSHAPHHHDHDGDEDHDEDHHHGVRGHSESNLRPVCPFLAMLVPKLEGVQEEMDQIVRAANASFMKSPHDKQAAGDEQQASDYELLMEKMANAMETSVVGVYPDLENNKAVTVFDIFYEQGAELLRSRWAIEVDQATGRWGLWQQGSLKTGEAVISTAPGKESTAVVSQVHEVIHALKEVGHSHKCKTLGKQLSYAAELDVINADEFDFSNWHMSKRHGRHHHDDDESSHGDDRPMYDRLVGRTAIQQVCETWAARQQRHITMQFVHPEEMFVRPVFGKKATYDVLVTGSVEMKTVFADKVVHWPGAVRMVLHTGSSQVSQLKVYTLEATSLEAKWGWKYGSGGMAGWMKAMLAMGSFAAVLVIFCCLCACVVSAACSTMWSNYFFTRCRSRRVVRAAPHGQVAAASAQPPQQATVRSDMAVPLRSAPLVPAPPTTVTPQ